LLPRDALNRPAGWSKVRAKGGAKERKSEVKALRLGQKGGDPSKVGLRKLNGPRLKHCWAGSIGKGEVKRLSKQISRKSTSLDGARDVSSFLSRRMLEQTAEHRRGMAKKETGGQH